MLAVTHCHLSMWMHGEMVRPSIDLHVLIEARSMKKVSVMLDASCWLGLGASRLTHFSMFSMLNVLRLSPGNQRTVLSL